MLYNNYVYKILQTEKYKKWFKKLRDIVGGDKSTQEDDIKTAKRMAKEL